MSTATDWTKVTCEKCCFRKNRVCRRFPPVRSGGESNYPTVRSLIAFDAETDEFLYGSACAEYKDDQGYASSPNIKLVIEGIMKVLPLIHDGHVDAAKDSLDGVVMYLEKYIDIKEDD